MSVLNEKSPILSFKSASKSKLEYTNDFVYHTQEQTGFTITSNSGNLISQTWSKWSKTTQGIICALGVTLSISALALFISIGSSSSQNLIKSANNQILKQNYKDNYEPLLEIPQGKLKWNVLQSREGRDYYAFYKIPYGQPPVGELRFEPPQPAEAWEGILHEKEVAPQCIQKSKYSPIVEAVGEEDCLYLNLYTPKLPSQDSPHLMPVMFYIHGGMFTDGNGSRYGGNYFLDEDVILITFQYRLGSLGFLSTENDGVIKGNMGMKGGIFLRAIVLGGYSSNTERLDQVMALSWVNQNIKYFGGNSQKIMIFGNSAGALSVSQLMLSPMANGLFNTAITQSGGAFCSSSLNITERQKTTFELFAREVGCWPTSNRGSEKRRNKRVLKCLQKLNASDLAVVRKPDISYTQTIEIYEAEDEEQEANKFFPDSPYNLLKSGRVNKVPWIIGVNSAEFVSLAAADLKDVELVEQMNTNWTAVAPTISGYPYYGPSADLISNKAREFYFGDKPVGNETGRNLTNFVSDRSWIHCSKTQAIIQSAYSDVYMYYLSKRPAKSYSDGALAGFPPADYGASHADELQYFFNYYGYPEYLQGSEYYPFSRMLIKMWVHFAATGNPKTERSSEWEKVKEGQKPISWFELNDNPHPTTILQSRMEFWDQFTIEQLCYA